MEPTPRPRIDLHRHLEGAMRPSTVAELAARDGTLRDHPDVRAAIAVDGPVDGLLPYLGRIDTATSTLTTLDDVRRIACEAVEDAHDEELDHVELRFSPGYVARWHGLAPDGVVEAVADGTSSAADDLDLSVALIGILSRTFGLEATEVELEAILRHRGVLAGIDLAGDEHGWPCSLFAAQIDRARDAGLHVTVHAGEGAGPASVREALDHLRPERIGHGVRATEDRQLCERLAERGVVLEVALTSNVHTRTCGRLEEHQARALLDAGVRITLNTDNPTVSSTTWQREVQEAAPAAGLTPREIADAAITAADAAFVDASVRRRLRRLASAPPEPSRRNRRRGATTGRA